MKKNPRTKHVELNPYNCSLWITNDLGHAEQEFLKFYPGMEQCDLGSKDKASGASMAAYVTKLHFDGNTEDSSVVLAVFLEKPDINVAAHEAVHIKNFVFERTGVKNVACPGEDEHEAYLVGWIAEQIWETFKNAKKDKITGNGQTKNQEGSVP